MIGNHPSGFEGFQSRMEQMEEQLGGDWLASRTVEQYWADAIDDVLRKKARRHAEVGLAYRAHHRSGWVRATPEDWDAASAAGEARFPPVDPAYVLSVVEYDGQPYALGERTLHRLGRDREGPGILLARARASAVLEGEAEVALSETGLALIEHRQFKRVRSKFRRCSPAGIPRTLRNFAEAMGVVFP